MKEWSPLRYGIETWIHGCYTLILDIKSRRDWKNELTKVLSTRLHALEMWKHRICLRTLRTEHGANNEEIDCIGKIILVSNEERKWKYFGHLIRKNGSLRLVIQDKMDG